MDDLSTLSDEEIQRYRRKVGIVFQDDKLIHTLSIKENITYPLRLEGESESSINAKYRAIIEKL
jgi:ABC-type ATPase involved in cell division